MFLFSLTPCRGAVVCLEPYKTNIHTAVFVQSKTKYNAEAKVSVTFLVGVRKINKYDSHSVPNFHLHRHSHIYLYIFTVHQYF